MTAQPNPRTHPYLDLLEPYVPPDLLAVAASSGVERADLLRLSANENQLGPFPEAISAIAENDEHGYYGDYGPLREALARYAEVRPEQVVATNGADEAIDLLIRLLVEPGQTVVVCPPTFGMYQFCARVNRCRVLPLPRLADFTLDVAAVEDGVAARGSDARLLFIASPGNPHGKVTSLRELERLLELPLFIAVDEAYIEFGGESAVRLLGEHQNLIVIRTFSKWAGLAGLRLGYVVAGQEIVSYLDRIRAPYNVSSAAAVAAMATLENLDAARDRVRLLVTERERMTTALKGFDWLQPVPGDGNFILIRVQGMTGKRLADALEARGILIAAFVDPVLAHHVRITVGRSDQNDVVLDALAAIGGELGGLR